MKTPAERNLRYLYVRYADELRAYLTGQVHCAHTAADLVQDAFVRLAQQPAAAGETNARAYLYRIAQNLAIDHFRRNERRQTDITAPQELTDIADEAPAPEQAIEGASQMRELQRIMAELPPLTREIFALHRIEGLTYAAIARRLAISDSSVQKHLSRALQHVMEQRRRMGAT